MVINNPYAQYKENSVFTATPEELTLMLYNGLVKFILQGINAIEEKNIKKANGCLIRCQDIITEFRATLDMNYEISKSFDSIYEYMYRRLVDANIRKDKAILEEVLGYAKELRDTWQEAMKLAKRGR
ncbi:flagellar export chaperone FliS [Clostridium thermosuccinogenes]|uniref:Flagellar secretion chaperone FliS n=1 Tax=Clostridium thermosuccinogenes TaxID=84032 RepID=A0A2K2EYS8_9CLOT|nr:flagellar export chaperone FliS [Pseudoclostridium thermosuccinogenes]AUS98621.1 flagellar export chaperone FliS [Pseudoclostridium thermosuccinogenes]PNT91672.1 flagellar export chaperone FliS [Pseudoclostridium thermosuccinogenes]PNT99220.1 flagellar export chaperone FliS [Pseudoclostridium thermosuccinogenes]PNU01024.1 flagellar export chaperone FliS [Pseudoclostridium thermosuccinogenes]